MKIESSYITLRGLRIHALHGVMPQERVVGNEYEVNINIAYPIGEAMISDDVADTLNYASVAELVKDEMLTPCNLFERVAYRIGDRLFREYPKITSADISITKINPPMGCDCLGAGVKVCLINDKSNDK